MSANRATTDRAPRSIEVAGNRIESRDLFSDARELVIVHNDEEYKLRITGNSKLILTK